jgi:hypothetical protein
MKFYTTTIFALFPIMAVLPCQSAQAAASNDAIDRYEIVKREGTLVAICVAAGSVAAAYLQASLAE